MTGVVTPLGLYDALELGGTQTPTFVYAVDHGVFGMATGPRLNHTFTRLCGSPPLPCPSGGELGVVSSGGGWINTSYPFGLRTRVSDDIIEVFSSGTRGAHTTISNFFDIEWRQLTWTREHISTNNPYTYDNGSAYSVARFQQVDSSILDDSYKVAEGLIVDALDGGLGFRNHTIPAGLPYGGRWTEDILFIEPETECVNTNLTIGWTITTEISPNIALGEGSGFKELALTDRGGFANLTLEYPSFNRDISQENPSLRDRAYKGAWLNNLYSALVLNVTNSNYNTNYSGAFKYLNSNVGKSFPLPSFIQSSGNGINGLFVSRDFGTYLNAGDLDDASMFPNPEKVTSTEFEEISKLTRIVAKYRRSGS